MPPTTPATNHQGGWPLLCGGQYPPDQPWHSRAAGHPPCCRAAGHSGAHQLCAEALAEPDSTDCCHSGRFEPPLP